MSLIIGFQYSIEIMPDIAVLNISKVTENYTQAHVLIANITKENAIEMITEYAMHKAAENFYKTPINWIVPNHTINRTSGA